MPRYIGKSISAPGRRAFRHRPRTLQPTIFHHRCVLGLCAALPHAHARILGDRGGGRTPVRVCWQSSLRRIIRARRPQGHFPISPTRPMRRAAETRFRRQPRSFRVRGTRRRAARERVRFRRRAGRPVVGARPRRWARDAAETIEVDTTCAGRGSIADAPAPSARIVGGPPAISAARHYGSVRSGRAGFAGRRS